MFFVTAHLGQPHGSAKSARDFAKALLANSNNVSIISPFIENFETSAIGHNLTKPRWFKYSHRPDIKDKLMSPMTILRRFQCLSRRWRINRMMEGNQVIVNGWASYSYWKQLNIKSFKHSAIIIRESPRHFKYQDRPDTFEAMIAGFSEFDRLIFVSDRLRVEWTQRGELSQKPTYYLPNCCEEEEVALIKSNDRREIRHQLNFRDEDFIVICPGTIEKRKGQDIALNALPEIIEVIPNVRLVFLGNAGTDWGHTLARKMDAGDYGGHVRHIPTQPSALEYLYAADVLLFPSRAEALPRTILEGMAFGMPIVATKVDGIPELIDNGVSGWLFELDDPAGMVEALQEVAYQHKRTRIMAKIAERRYIKYFSRRKQLERVSSMLNWFEANDSIKASKN